MTILNGQVLVKPEPKAKSVIEVIGGQVEPLAYDNIGTVVEVGKGVCAEVVKGVRVVFPLYAGRDVERGGEKFLLLTSDAILGTVE
jgi:co-chaperonin GroES (HSP10)